MTIFDSSVFWPEFKEAGMLRLASTILPGCTEATEFDVRLVMPDVITANGQVSREYAIEYQHADAPTLAEGAEVLIDCTLYLVREDPFVDEEGGADGYFRKALLTRVATT